MKKILVTALCLAPMLAIAGGMNEPSYSHSEHRKPHHHWTGFYAGINLGASGNNNETSYDYSYIAGQDANFAAFFGNNADNGGLGAGPANVGGLNAVASALTQGILVKELGDEGDYVFEGGGQAGYNWVRHNYMVGFEADIQWFGENDSISHTGTIPGEFTNTFKTESNVDWLNTDRFRIGYTFDRFLPYLTGGFAVGGTETKSSSIGTDGSTIDTFIGKDNDTRIGWAAGGGLEYLFDMNFNVRVEGIYYNLGEVEYDVAPQDAGSAEEGITNTASHTFDGVMIRAAVNYLFW